MHMISLRPKIIYLHLFVEFYLRRLQGVAKFSFLFAAIINLTSDQSERLDLRSFLFRLSFYLDLVKESRNFRSLSVV